MATTQVESDITLRLVDLTTIGRATHVIAAFGKVYLSFIGDDAAQCFDRVARALRQFEYCGTGRLSSRPPDELLYDFPPDELEALR